MPSEIQRLKDEIQRLNVRYDGIDESRVDERKAIEDRVRDLREQVAELEAAPPPPPTDMVQEAKDDIDAVKDIVGAKPDPAPPEQSSDADVAETLGFVEASAEAVSDPKSQAWRERTAAERAAKAAEDKARRAAEEAEQAQHPAGHEFQQGTDAALAQGPEAARGKDATTVKMAEEAQKRGCIVPSKTLVGIGIGGAVVIAVILVLLNGGDADEPAATPSPTTSSAPSAAADPDGAGAPGGDEAPDPTGLAAGEQLFTGTSGAQIGCIPCDGQGRFLSIEAPGVAVGTQEGLGQQVAWTGGSGDITGFGVTTKGTRNKGRYGFNVFRNGSTYSGGCSLEAGQTKCEQRNVEGARIEAGDRVNIIIGEKGTVDDKGVPIEKGEFVVDWWFTFKPDS